MWCLFVECSSVHFSVFVMVVSGDEEILSEAKSDAYLPSIEKASRRFHSWMIGYLRIGNQVRKRFCRSRIIKIAGV